MNAIKTRSLLAEMEAAKYMLHIAVADHHPEDLFIPYNTTRTGHELIETTESVDIGPYMAEVQLIVDFSYEASHQRGTPDQPEQSSIEYAPTRLQIDITNVDIWNEEKEEMQQYRLCATERKKIIAHLTQNINLY